MALNSGFAFVATAKEDLLNRGLAVAVESLVPPISAPVQTVQIGNQEVLLGGTLVVLPPSVTLQARADNQVTLHAAFAGVVSAGIGASSASYELVLRTDVDLGLVPVTTAKNQIAVGIDFSAATVTSIVLFSISGAPPAGTVLAAFHSDSFLTLLSDLLRLLGTQTVTPGLLKNEFHLSQTYVPYEWSVFDPPALYDVTLDISRVVIKPLDGVLAVAIDLAGLSAGDPAGLTAINNAWEPSAVIRTVTQDGSSHLGGGYAGPRDSDIAVTANADVIVAVVGLISGQMSGKFPSDNHVQINGLSAAFGLQQPPLAAMAVPGILLTADVTYWLHTTRDAAGYIQPVEDGIGATAKIYTDLELTTFDGPTAWLSRQPPDYYVVRVLGVDINPSGWLATVVIALGYFLSMITWGIAAPVAIIGVVTLLDGVIPGMIGNVETEVAAKLQAGLNAEENSLSIGAARTGGTTVETLIADDGIYAFVNVDLSVPAPSLQVTPGTFETTGTDPNPAWHVSVYDPTPVTCRLSAPPPIGNPLDPTWRIAWTVVRTDANMTILSSDQLASTPGALTIEIDHASPGLMAADRFMVTCRLYRNLGYTVEEAFFERFYIDIDDYLNRHHPYVHWDAVVYWQAAGQPPGTYWTRWRRSRIHRTAVPGRCEVMRSQPWAFRTRKSKADPRVALATGHSRGFVYLDSLPFPLTEINEHRRGVLCDYCFYGGPTRTVPLIEIPWPDQQPDAIDPTPWWMANKPPGN